MTKLTINADGLANLYSHALKSGTLDKWCLLAIEYAVAADKSGKLVEDERNGLLSDRELLLWCLNGNQVWYGATINDGGGYYAIYQPAPYKAFDTWGKVHKDPMDALRAYRDWCEDRA